MGDELLARDPRIAGIGLATARFDRRSGRLLLVSEAERASGTPIRGDYIGGNRLPIYRVAAIRDVGVFDPKLFFGFEELDFGLRLRRAGYSLYEYRSPGHREWAESAARAAEGPRWGRSPGFGMPSARVREPTWRDYYNLRNLIYILKKQGRHAAGARVIIVRGIGKPLANLPLAPTIAWANLRLNVRACRDALGGKMGRTLEPEPKG